MLKLIARLATIPLASAAFASPIYFCLEPTGLLAGVVFLVLVQVLAALVLPPHLPRRGVVTYRVQGVRGPQGPQGPGLNPRVQAKIFDGMAEALKSPAPSRPDSDHIDALVRLGFPRLKAKAAIRAAVASGATSEAKILGTALRHLSVPS